jgi:hypothetical protein
MQFCQNFLEAIESSLICFLSSSSKKGMNFLVDEKRFEIPPSRIVFFHVIPGIYPIVKNGEP